MNLFLNAEEAEASSPFIRGLRIIRQTSFRLLAACIVEHSNETTARESAELIERVTHFAGHNQKPYTKKKEPLSSLYYGVKWGLSTGRHSSDHPFCFACASDLKEAIATHTNTTT